jgi:uncharacterized protein YneF (UPF0154 family)
MNSAHVFRTWVLYQSLGLGLGWFFHSLISHLWTGDHEYVLTMPQLIMHNVSLVGCVLIMLLIQNTATQRLFRLNLLRQAWIYVVAPTLLFWLGFYLKAVPLDVLLWFLTVGFLNGLFISRHLQKKSWIGWSMLSAVVGFVVGAAILIPFDAYLSSLTGLIAHVVMFTLLGLVAGIPMAISGGFFLQRIVSKSVEPSDPPIHVQQPTN